MLKVAVIGLGDVSKIHLAAIKNNPVAELVAVSDIDDTLKSSVPDVRFYQNYLDMLGKETLDCVHVCLPHHLHDPVTRACVERGIHVFQEKPLARTVEEGKALVELEQQYKNIKICVSFQNRLNESFVKLQEIIQSGELGNLMGVKGLVPWFRPKSYYDAKPWRGKMGKAGGGVMINQAIHTLDLMQLVGGEVLSVKGSIDQLLNYGYEVEDTATAHLIFKNGATGLFFATNANVANSSVELEVFLERGTLTIKDSVLTKQVNGGGKEDIVEDTKLSGSKSYYGASHSKLISQFYQCILDNTQNYIHVKEAQVTMGLIDAIRQSSSQNTEISMAGYTID